jgi:hypothetical protein
VLEDRPDLVALLPERLLEGARGDLLEEAALEDAVDLGELVEAGEVDDHRRHARLLAVGGLVGAHLECGG